MNSLRIRPVELSRTFSLIARHDTHFFLDQELPEFLDRVGRERTVPFRSYFKSLRSGEYIPKASYSDRETDYVYLTIGQFSGPQVSFEDLTFLDETVGASLKHLTVKEGNLVVTRSGTVGVVHRFQPPDGKIYIPSHHLAVVDLPEDEEHSIEYLRLFLQSRFARAYFWAFASGKSQKEISNWSIKSIPIPQCDRPHEVASLILTIEKEVAMLQAEIEKKLIEKDEILLAAIAEEST